MRRQVRFLQGTQARRSLLHTAVEALSSGMPVPAGPPLVVACYHGHWLEVRRLLAAGADPLAVGLLGPGRIPIGGPAIAWALHFGWHNCVEALLATGNLQLLEQRQFKLGHPGLPPLVTLVKKMTDPGHIYFGLGSHPLECLHLLLEAGASLDPVDEVLRTDLRSGGQATGPRHDALECARESGNEDLVRVLEDAARWRYSTQRHRRFPRSARYAAAEWLRLGYRVGSGALVPVWAEHVLPFLVSRTSRGAAPRVSRQVAFIDALPGGQVEAMLASDDSVERAAATLELQWRASGHHQVVSRPRSERTKCFGCLESSLP